MNKVLITGVKGFICSNLTCYLVNKYSNILFVGIDSNSYCSDDDNIKEIRNKSNFIYFDIDITRTTQVMWLFNSFKFDRVFNFAAYSSVDRSFTDPLEVFINNVIGTFTLIECSRLYKVSQFIQMSTDEVYGDKHAIADENSMLNPTNPYSGSKASADMMLISYINGYKFPAIIIRCNNVYGIKQYPEKVIPKFIMKLSKGQRCQIQGDGTQTRSFIHVDDFCDAFDMISEKGVTGEIYNIGSDDDISVYELFLLIRDKYIEVYGEVENKDPRFVEDRKYNDKHYTIKCDKLKELGWNQKRRLEDNIKELVVYYHNKFKLID